MNARFDVNVRYPLGFTAVTDRGKPHHLRVCNVPVVFWHDGDAWRAAIDECPHRRVRLSEGRLEGSEQLGVQDLLSYYWCS